VQFPRVSGLVRRLARARKQAVRYEAFSRAVAPGCGFHPVCRDSVLSVAGRSHCLVWSRRSGQGHSSVPRAFCHCCWICTGAYRQYAITIALCIKNGNQGPSYRRHLAGCREGILPSFGGGTPPVQPKTSITSAYTRLAAADARNVRGRHRDTSQCIRFFAGINARYSGSPLLHSSWYSCLWPSASLTIAASTGASHPFARCTWAVSEMGEHAATSAGNTLSTRRT